MTDTHQLFIIGDSLFAETLTQLLAVAPAVAVLGVVPDIDEALPQVRTLRPDAVIVAATDAGQIRLGPLSALLPELPIICADLNDDYVHLITSRRIGTRYADLLAAIHALPKRDAFHSAGITAKDHQNRPA
jgi:hypothetical protein